MKRFLGSAIVLSLLSSSAVAAELKVLSDRTESHLTPIFEAYEKKTGVKVKAVFLTKGLLERLESNPAEADVVITADADILAIAKSKKLLAPISSEKIEGVVPTEFRDTDKQYFVDAFRARVILYSKDRVKPEMLSTYEDLASPKWKGKLCIRSGYHDYNLSLFGQMVVSYGAEKAKTIMSGYHANLAREPKGNDREQAKGIFEGKCDVALLNTYYYPIMMNNPDQKPWALATKVFLPDQKGKGAFIMRSGVAIPKENKTPAAAIQFLEYLVSPDAQKIMVQNTFQYPVNAEAKKEVVKLESVEQEILEGSFKKNFVNLDEIAKNRENVVKMLNEINFDKLQK